MTRDLTPEQQERVRALFEEAQKLGEAEQVVLLRGTAEDPDVIEEVKSLLVAAAGSPFTLPVEGPPGGSDPTPRLARIRAHTSTDRYQLRGRIGRGGQGAVYEVWDEDLARRLAMKVVLGKEDGRSATDTPPADPETVSRFLEEAQVTGQLDHPGVVPVHELGLDPQGQVYFTMRLVRGEDLSEIIRKVHGGEEGWTPIRILGAVLKACEALAYAHAKKVIHRDLKPSNLMVGKYGEVYVMDWGLARVLDQADRHDLRLTEAPQTSTLKTDRRKSREGGLDSPLVTMDGRVLGTPSYMPPEQAQGRIEAMGPASDVYSMGAVLYQLLTGIIPYVPPDGQISARTVLACVLAGPPTPVAELAPESPVELVAICEKAMARRMEDRYRDMEALAVDLRAFLEGRVVAAFESGPWAELRKWVKRNRGWAATGSVALVFLVVALGWALVERARADDEATRASAAAESERVAKKEAVQSAELARRNEKDANEAKALAERREKEAEAARALAVENEQLAIAEKKRVLRLSDIKLVADYAAEADRLYPAHPDRIDDLRAWLEKAKEIYARLPVHLEALAEVRKSAVPRSAERIESERRSHPKFTDLQREEGRLNWLRSLGPVVAGGAPPALPSLPDEELPTDAAALNELAWPLVDPQRKEYGDELRGGALAEHLAALDPAFARQWDTVAWARLATGRFDAAREAIATAIERASDAEKKSFEEARARLEESMGLFRGEEAAEKYAARVRTLEETIASLEEEVSRRERWEFPEGETNLAWQHQVLERPSCDLAYSPFATRRRSVALTIALSANTSPTKKCSRFENTSFR